MKRIEHPTCDCPKGTGSFVIETRFDTRYGFARRKRVCHGCSATFYTYEVPVSSLDMDDFTPINFDGGIE